MSDRLISANVLKSLILQSQFKIGQDSAWHVLGLIDSTPAVGAKPVKHGHWIKLFEDKDSIQARCSACGMVYSLGKGRDPNYCGTCGAKMDEEAQP